MNALKKLFYRLKKSWHSKRAWHYAGIVEYLDEFVYGRDDAEEVVKYVRICNKHFDKVEECKAKLTKLK